MGVFTKYSSLLYRVVFCSLEPFPNIIIMIVKPERLWILVAKKKAGEASPEELDELKGLLSENISSGYTYDVIDKIWEAQLTTSPEEQLPQNVWQNIDSKTNEGKMGGKYRLLQPAYRIAAACLLLLFSVAGIIAYRYNNNTGTALAQNDNLNQFTTRAGSKSKLELPDGTQVWLNGNSKLTYSNGNFNSQNREVILSGEAFFDVVKNARLPFIIHTGKVNITVKGTAFNVKAYPEEKTIETTLVRGLVEITTEQDPDRKILLKPNEKIIIPVDEEASSNETAVAADTTTGGPLYAITRFRSSVEEPAEIAWINTQLVFDNEPLGKIAPKLESWYHINIRFLDEEMKSKRFSGVIEKETLKETLEALQLSYHFNYQIRENELVISNK